MRLFHALAAATLWATPLAAADLTVGPGRAFAQIADAVLAAQPGDSILVEPGTYQGFLLDKPLRILGTGPGVVVDDLGGHGIEILHIAAGEQALVAGLEVRPLPILAVPQAGVVVRDCAGTVVLSDLVVRPSQAAYGLYVEDCARLMVLSSSVFNAGGAAGMFATGSEVWLANSFVVGQLLSFSTTQEGPDGLFLQDGSLHAWRSTVQGGAGSGGKPAFPFPPHGGDGLVADNAEVVLYGGPEGGIFGGKGGPAGFFVGPGDGGAGVRLVNGSTARLQQDLVIQGGLDGSGSIPAPDVSVDGTSSSSTEPRVFPTLEADAVGTPGAPFQVRADGNPGAPVVLFVSLGTGPTLAFPGVEGLGALQATFFQVGFSTLDGGGQLAFPLTVPTGPTLVGEALIFQAVEAGAGGKAITNPVAVGIL